MKLHEHGLCGTDCDFSDDQNQRICDECTEQTYMAKLSEPNMYARRKGMLNELAGKIKTPLLKATEKGA